MRNQPKPAKKKDTRDFSVFKPAHRGPLPQKPATPPPAPVTPTPVVSAPAAPVSASKAA